ncbi:MAG: trypsin-like peptidase domain-containing protein [Cyanobacteria bacterium P01_G01_bin.54]
MSESAKAIDHLKSCTVCINRSSSQRGTGFFVVQGQILTCHHVIKDKTKIEIWWQGNPYPAEVTGHAEDADLALLQLTGNVPEHPVVELDLTVAIDDPLYSFGYTDQYVDGDPADFGYVDETGGDWPLMKFKEGQVRPGLSGSPLLNRRTGKVCGVVQKTRDRSSALGGRGIPMSTVFKVFPQLQPKKVITVNPFTQRGMIDDVALIYGRETELGRILEFLNGGSSVALVGQSGIGKSSLLSTVCHKAAQLREPRQPVYLNMSHLFSEADYYAALCDEIGIPYCSGYRFSKALKHKRILLLLDEVERMTQDWFTRPVRQQFRGLANSGSSSSLRLVVTAQSSLNQLFKDSGQDSPFQEICQELALEPWSKKVTKNFIQLRLAGTAIRFTDEEIFEIINQSGGIPSQVVQGCYQVYERYRD